MIYKQFQDLQLSAKFGYLKTSIQFGLRHPEVQAELKEYIKELGKTLK